MTLSRRQFIKFSSFTIAGAALAACAPQAEEAAPAASDSSGGDSSASQSSEEASPDAAKIEMVYHTWTVPPEGAGEIVGTDAFMEANPNIVVEHRQTPFSDYWKALLTDAGIGEPPDAYLMNNFNWQEYINAGMGIDLLPAAAILDTPGTNVDDYIPSLLDAAKREGKLYGFPKATNGSAFITNKTLFEERGVDLPPNDRDWTYAEFEAAAEAMTDEEAKLFGCNVIWGQSWTPTFIFTNGGSFLDPEEHKFAEGYLNGEPVVEWVTWAKKLVGNGWNPAPGGLDAFGGGNGAMLGGNLGIIHTDGFHQVALADRADSPYEWSGARTPVPAEDVPLVPHVAIHGVMVPEGVKDVSKAVELAGYATYGATTDMNFPSKMSTRKDFAEKQALDVFPHFRPLYDQVFQDNVRLHEGALITNVSILSEEVTQMFERVLLDGMDPQESLNIAAANFDKRAAEKEA